MATRFYFSASNTPSQSPGFAAWTRTTEGVRRNMSTVKDGTTLATRSIFAGTSPAANASCLAVQFISPPLQAGIAFVTTDTFSCITKVSESATNDNLNRHPIAIKVYDKDGTTLRATLKALGHYGPTTTEWPTTAATKILGNAVVLGANYTTAAGDLLVVEIGGQVDATGGTSVTGTMTVGNSAASDYALTESLTTNLNPWFELSRTFSFLFTAAGDATIGGITADGVATFAAPPVTATGDATIGGVTADGVATFANPIYTATGSATLGGITAAGVATFAAPVATATGSATVGGVTAAGAGTFAAGTFTAAGSATIGGITAAGIAQQSANHPVGHLTRSVTGLGVKRSGDFSGKPSTPPTFVAAGDATLGGITATAGGIFAAPHPVGHLTRSVTGLGVKRAGSFSGKAGATSATGDGAATIGGVTAAGVATFAAPVYTGTGAATIGGITADAAGTFFITGYSGAATATVGGMTALAVGTFAQPIYTASGSAAVGGITAAGIGTVGDALYTATGSATVGGVTALGIGSAVSLNDLLLDLAACYRFDDDLTDSSGNGRDLTGTVTYAPGQLGDGLTDGTATVNPWTGFTGLPMSFSFWWKPTAGAGGNILFNGDGPDPFGLSLGAGGEIGYVGLGFVANTAVVLDVFSHVVYTVDASGGATLYVNGVSVATFTAIPPAAFSSLNVQSTGPSVIDQLLVYGRDLNIAAVLALWNGGDGFDPTAMVAPINRVEFTLPITRRHEFALPITRRREFPEE